MFRFTIRDMLWLTAAIGLAITWRFEQRTWQKARQTFAELGAIADEAALAGRWEILAITSSGVTKTFPAGSDASMSFYDGYWRLRYADAAEDWEYKLIRPNEINFDSMPPPGGVKVTGKWRYELKDGKLRLIRSSDPAERPTAFDAISDPTLTLYELRKKSLEPEPPAEQPRSGRVGTEI
jgi:hypothetical protein